MYGLIIQINQIKNYSHFKENCLFKFIHFIIAPVLIYFYLSYKNYCGDFSSLGNYLRWGCLIFSWTFHVYMYIYTFFGGRTGP